MQEKIILFYKYIFIQYPIQAKKWQKKLCEELSLKGRIILAHEGINGTLGGSIENIAKYIQSMNEHPLFFNIDFKESNGNSKCFPKMKVLVKDEIVKFGIDTNLVTVKDTGKHLTPEETHQLINNNKNLVILDARNNYESQVGAFKNAIRPDIKNFRDLPNFINENLELFKNKEVLMYCTGGIRCERASAYLKLKNISKEVYQIQGGIQRYIEKFPDGYFRGKNYVFDARLTVKINEDVLGNCYICKTPCDEYANCFNARCNKHFIGCINCKKNLENSCSDTCLQLIKDNKVNIRPEFKKMESCKN